MNRSEEVNQREEGKPEEGNEPTRGSEPKPGNEPKAGSKTREEEMWCNNSLNLKAQTIMMGYRGSAGMLLCCQRGIFWVFFGEEAGRQVRISLFGRQPMSRVLFFK